MNNTKSLNDESLSSSGVCCVHSDCNIQGDKFSFIADLNENVDVV